MRIKFMSLQSYTVVGNGPGLKAAKICLNPNLGMKHGAKYFEATLSNGVIVLIPEDLEPEYRQKA